MSKLEVIKVFASRMEAELARGYLEAMGIKTRVVSDDADQLYPSYAMRVLILSRTKYWPNAVPKTAVDGRLETILSEWLRSLK